jgi:hypothetical protein
MDSCLVSKRGESDVRIFLITLVVSTVGAIALWQFGLAHKIWPAHPFLATIAIVASCGIAVQLLLSHDAASHKQ